ncbi:NusA antitermination factor [Lachnospiraceae bacterium C10]|jgi:N utilization substance protein A|nr:NusA antitermination factor [Lachnospiraceae bacterium C10]SDW04468.1 NusA antitermination factor [Lachnospiraceae bacterium KHCPX20]
MANSELLDALTVLEKEKNISRDTILATIEDALLVACKNNYGTDENFSVTMNRDTCEYHVFAAKEVVEEVFDPIIEISLEEAHEIDGSFKIGDVVNVEIKSQSFGRIATSAAKGVILQKLKEEERNLIFNEYEDKAHTIITGTVSRYIGKNISVNLGKTDAILTENEQIKGEHYNTNDRIKVYVLEVRNNPRGPRIRVSRTHPDLVRCLFEEEVSEVREGIVEIKGIAREAGNRSKIAVWSNDPDVDPVGACVGMNGSRVNAIVNELGNEKIDVVEWNENPAMLIENALSPAKVIAVVADSDEKTAKVVVPDYQLSLAIGREGQNARLAARLTGFKIDIKSETQAREAGDFLDYEEEYEEDEYFDEEEYYDETSAQTEAEATEE